MYTYETEETLGTTYSNKKRFSKDSDKREVIEDFCSWLEEFFEVCDGAKK